MQEFRRSITRGNEQTTSRPVDADRRTDGLDARTYAGTEVALMELRLSIVLPRDGQDVGTQKKYFGFQRKIIRTTLRLIAATIATQVTW